MKATPQEQEKRRRLHANLCVECGEANPSDDVRRMFCSGVCRQRDYRRRKRATGPPKG